MREYVSFFLQLAKMIEKLLDQKIHPTIITRGYRWAEEKAQKILEEIRSGG